MAFEYVGLEWQNHVTIDRGLFRPTEIMIGKGDASKAERVLAWRPKYRMEEVIRMMVDASRLEQGEAKIFKTSAVN